MGEKLEREQKRDIRGASVASRQRRREKKRGDRRGRKVRK